MCANFLRGFTGIKRFWEAVNVKSGDELMRVDMLLSDAKYSVSCTD
ncbi:unnamed protein product [Brassica rapa]|uniref:Uncharacterized protein n=1 Tax=Brassica campestris TaxID=3711 RepID=A0A3P6BD49_BRACM|nr:unnamed protein product [Brassica rapa]VDD04007.1 unnamed protein product [Brassica rapa]